MNYCLIPKNYPSSSSNSPNSSIIFHFPIFFVCSFLVFYFKTLIQFFFLISNRNAYMKHVQIKCNRIYYHLYLLHHHKSSLFKNTTSNQCTYNIIVFHYLSMIKFACLILHFLLSMDFSLILKILIQLIYR